MADTDNEPGDGFAIGHKFKPISERLWDSLRAGDVYFASPSDLNDPFDCQIDMVKARKLALATVGRQMLGDEEHRWQKIADHINNQAKTCGVFSLCAGEIVGNNSQLFWPHYGDCHRGVCLTYRIPYSFVLEEMIGIASVDYGTDKLFAALNELSLVTRPTFEEVKPLITALLTTKAKAWEYEEEFRLVAFKAGPQKIERAWLAQICFGLRVDEKTKQKTISAMREWGYNECTFAEVHVSEAGLLDLAIREVEATS